MKRSKFKKEDPNQCLKITKMVPMICMKTYNLKMKPRLIWQVIEVIWKGKTKTNKHMEKV